MSDDKGFDGPGLPQWDYATGPGGGSQRIPVITEGDSPTYTSLLISGPLRNPVVVDGRNLQALSLTICNPQSGLVINGVNQVDILTPGPRTPPGGAVDPAGNVTIYLEAGDTAIPEVPKHKRVPRELILTGAYNRATEVFRHTFPFLVRSVPTIVTPPSPPFPPVFPSAYVTRTFDYDVQVSDSGSQFDNNGADDSVTLTLPPWRVGLIWAFVVVSPQEVAISARDPDRISMYSALTTRISSATPYSGIVIGTTNQPGVYFGTSITGGWSAL